MQVDFHTICHRLSLGSLLDAPRPLSGGYMHRMFALHTTQGRYAVKLLNPDVMARPTAMNNYRQAEAFEALLEERGLPILPALTIGGQKMQRIDGQYLYVFEYVDGRALQDGEITPAHCAAMGSVLAQIHALCHREAPEEAAEPLPDWPPLIAGLLRDPESAVEGTRMHCALPMLLQLTRKAALAALQLPKVQALCHNDMDAKNVLWQGDTFRIIDLECLNWGNPLQEMLDLAIFWAGWPQDQQRFTAFVKGYREAGGALPADASALYFSRRNHLDWLAASAVRALHPDPAQRQLGRRQIHETLDKLASDQKHAEQILRWLQEAAE